MKIQGPKNTGATSKAKKTAKTNQAGGDFDSFIAAGTQESAQTNTTQSIAHVDGLLAVQGAEDPTERASRGRMTRRSNDVLVELDKLRMAMLHGNLTVGHMIDIADVVASHREKISDPALTGLMDEIDLRAQVELAKLKVVLDGREGAENAA